MENLNKKMKKKLKIAFEFHSRKDKKYHLNIHHKDTIKFEWIKVDARCYKPLNFR